MKKSLRKSLGHHERWLRSSLDVLKPAVSSFHISVDMTNALKNIEIMREKGVRLSTTPLLIKAVAKTLDSNPDLHQLVAGSQREMLKEVDIGLSVSGESFVTPVLIIKKAEKKSIQEISEEIITLMPKVQEEDRKKLEKLKKWGWIIPFDFLRKYIMKIIFSNTSFRKKTMGTFQITTVPTEWAVSSVFATAGLIIAGEIRSKVVAVDGKPVVRPIMSLTLSVDHGIWNGRSASKFLASIQSELEKKND